MLGLLQPSTHSPNTRPTYHASAYQASLRRRETDDCVLSKFIALVFPSISLNRSVFCFYHANHEHQNFACCASLNVLLRNPSILWPFGSLGLSRRLNLFTDLQNTEQPMKNLNLSIILRSLYFISSFSRRIFIIRTTTTQEGNS